MRLRWLDGLLLIYSIELIVLAIYAYTEKHHIPSLLGGLVFGMAELGFLALSRTNPRPARMGSAAVALVLFFMFVGIMIGKGPAWNNVLIAASSLIVFLALGAGHMIAMRQRRSEATTV